ncbi:Hect ubiquitin ligase, partial [Globisporangium splendens]
MADSDSQALDIVAFQLLPGVVIVGLIILAIKCHNKNRSDLHTPLLSAETVEHRVDAATREADAGFSMCPGCEFENFKRFAYCSLCGERLIPKGDGAHKKTKPPLPSQCSEKAQTPTRTTKLKTQQIRVRKRKEWVRRIAVDGNVFWFRNHVPGCTDSSSLSAGYTISFKKRYGSCLFLLDGGMETIEPRVVTMDESISLELIAAPLANALTFPIQHSSSSTITGTLDLPSERLREVFTSSTHDFPTKYAHFVISTAAMIVPAEIAFLKLSVHRDYILEQSLDHVGCIKEKNIHSYMRINFIDESGVDAGGIHREWFMLVNEMLVDPTLRLFLCTNKPDQAYYVNPSSACDIGEDHLTYYYATGRLIGRALLEGCTWGFHLALPLLKTILGIPVSFSDLEYLDPEAYRSMVWLVENDGVDDLGLDFSVMENRGGELVQVELIPNGCNVAVTDENKHVYLKRKFEYLLFESVSDQLYMLLKGIYEVIPQELLLLFDAEELDYLLCGTQEIDVEDWKANTVVSSNLFLPRTLGWFWEVVSEMPNEYRRRLLQFSTGSSRVPLSGFAGLTSYDGRLCPFSLKGVAYSTTQYISSHACFNRLDLPLYRSKQELETVLYATLETELYGFTIE